MIRVLIQRNVTERQKRMNNDKQKTLEDLVPPLELCKAAREVIGDKTALVYKQVPYKYKDGIVVKKKWIICKRFDGREPQIPAPTLAEIRFHLRNMAVFMADGKWIVQCQVNPEEFKSEAANDESGIEAAALRLLMKVKGVTE